MWTRIHIASFLLPILASCSTSEGPSPRFDTGAPTDAMGEAWDTRSAAGAEGPILRNPAKYNTVLGRPTNASIAISVLAAGPGDQMWIEYGTELDATHLALVNSKSSAPQRSLAGEPIVVDLTGLASDTKYYYRVHYQATGAAEDVDAIHSFHTQRRPGSTFHFGVQGDSHPERSNNKMFHPELYTLTMQQVRERQPDLYFMLGDDFGIEQIIQTFKDDNFGAGYTFRKSVEGVMPYGQYQQLPHPFSQTQIVDGVAAPHGTASYLLQRQSYLGIFANATALLLVNGNHEQARSAYLGGVFNNAAIWAADGRLKYYPLPAPDGFYSGNATPLTARNGYPTVATADGLLRDYYAFVWGDALFVTLDPYWHSDNNPETSAYNGDRSDSKSIWNATIGDAQYAWLKETLETSQAKWKFVFAHHINGTGRGGATALGAGEWGASQAEFSARRPTWAKPIHQLFVDTRVTIFFQGHDHIFAREVIDGVVYQSVPNPGDNSYFAYNCDAYAPAALNWPGAKGYGVYDASQSVRMPNTGFLDVSVSADRVQVAYVRTYRPIDLTTDPNKIFSGREANGEDAFSYSVPVQPTDSRAEDFAYPCIGAAPPSSWVFNP